MQPRMCVASTVQVATATSLVQEFGIVKPRTLLRKLSDKTQRIQVTIWIPGHLGRGKEPFGGERSLLARSRNSTDPDVIYEPESPNSCESLANLVLETLLASYAWALIACYCWGGRAEGREGGRGGITGAWKMTDGFSLQACTQVLMQKSM